MEVKHERPLPFFFLLGPHLWERDGGLESIHFLRGGSPCSPRSSGVVVTGIELVAIRSFAELEAGLPTF